MNSDRDASKVAGDLLAWYERAPKDMQPIILEAARKLCDEGSRADALAQWYSNLAEAFQQEVLSLGDLTLADAPCEERGRLREANWIIFGLPMQVWLADGVGHAEVFARSGEVIWQHHFPDSDQMNAVGQPMGINADGSVVLRRAGPVASLDEYMPIMKERLADDIADAQSACDECPVPSVPKGGGA